LPALEKAMREQGLDPAEFVIARNLAQSTYLPIAFRPDGNLLECTVFVKDRSFTVTQPNDTRFLEYFYELCVPPKHADEAHSQLHTVEQKLESLFMRAARWLNRPI
jgi:hypothetical protein